MIFLPTRNDSRTTNTCSSACEEALTAVSEGNYGVGCVLVGPKGDVLLRNHNRVFSPYFRSDRHAEMVVMDEFEKTCRFGTNLGEHLLLCTLEPCPMCLGRLISSRIGVVKYAAPDPDGGMVQHLDRMPKSFRNLAENQRFVKADSSLEVQELAFEIFLSNLIDLRAKLFDRLNGDS